MVTDVNGDAYAGMDLPQVDAEWFEATDGKKIHAWIIKPPNFDPDKGKDDLRQKWTIVGDNRQMTKSICNQPLIVTTTKLQLCY